MLQDVVHIVITMIEMVYCCTCADIYATYNERPCHSFLTTPPTPPPIIVSQQDFFYELSAKHQVSLTVHLSTILANDQLNA